jgi:zinc/manganese transport system substrate-binding protein
MRSHWFWTLALGALLALLPRGATAEKKLSVVCTISSYAPIAQFIGGDKVEVFHIVDGRQDPHIVRPKPSLAMKLAEADLFVSTGLDLELWAPSLVDLSGNPRIRSGQEGYVKASAGIRILERPKSLDRSLGDIHVYGNPHIHTSPLNGKVIAENIYVGLSRVRPQDADYFRANLRRFKATVDRKLFGAKLVRILGGKLLTQLASKGRLLPFLQKRQYRGKPLLEYLGGWMKKALPLRGRKIITFHPNWIYFTELFGLEVVAFMEPKPGIPPSPRHVKKVIDLMKRENIKVILAANYFDIGKVHLVAEKVGAVPVIVGLAVGGEEGMNTFFDQFDIWIGKLVAAFAAVDSKGS